MTRLPFPAGAAELIYARLVLAHVLDPAVVAESWATQLTPAGALVIDEIERIETTNQVLRAHLDLATGQVATTGAVMCPARSLPASRPFPGSVPGPVS